MGFKGSSAYDENDFLTNYLKRRSRPDSPNNAIEGPAMKLLVGSVKGSRILDLGCGDGDYGLELLGQGASAYTGVEGSAAMAELASSRLAETSGKIIHTNMESYPFPQDEFDIVVSRMALHYIDDLESLFRSVNISLKKGGRFVFSVQHPVITSSFASKIGGDRRENWLVDDYFQQGMRNEPWLDETVVKYHRSIEGYFTPLISAGFLVDALQEGEPKRTNFEDFAEFERRKRIPLVLIFSCRKA